MKRRHRSKADLPVRDRLYNLATTALVILLVFLAIIFIYESRRSYTSYVEKPASILRAIDGANYDSAIESVSSARANGVDESKDSDYTEPFAVVDYFNAEMDYKMYTQAGDTAKAADAKARMDAAYAKMGNMQFKKDEIDKIINQEVASKTSEDSEESKSNA